jgi:hypothetical protein
VCLGELSWVGPQAALAHTGDISESFRLW